MPSSISESAVDYLKAVVCSGAALSLSNNGDDPLNLSTFAWMMASVYAIEGTARLQRNGQLGTVLSPVYGFFSKIAETITPDPATVYSCEIF